jgi:hypothetical protein
VNWPRKVILPRTLIASDHVFFTLCQETPTKRDAPGFTRDRTPRTPGLRLLRQRPVSSGLREVDGPVEILRDHMGIIRPCFLDLVSEAA